MARRCSSRCRRRRSSISMCVRSRLSTPTAALGFCITVSGIAIRPAQASPPRLVLVDSPPPSEGQPPPPPAHEPLPELLQDQHLPLQPALGTLPDANHPPLPPHCRPNAR